MRAAGEGGAAAGVHLLHSGWLSVIILMVALHADVPTPHLGGGGVCVVGLVTG